MKVGHVTERTDASSASSFLDSDELERTELTWEQLVASS